MNMIQCITESVATTSYETFELVHQGPQFVELERRSNVDPTLSRGSSICKRSRIHIRISEGRRINSPSLIPSKITSMAIYACVILYLKTNNGPYKSKRGMLQEIYIVCLFYSLLDRICSLTQAGSTRCPIYNGAFVRKPLLPKSTRRHVTGPQSKSITAGKSG